MELLILRHAQAVPQGFQGLSDEDRPLTPLGLHHAESLGRLLRDTGCIPSRVFSSPLVRARETALAVIRGSGAHPELEFTAELAPGGTFEPPRVDRILVVGHAPDVSRLAGFALRMPPCALARIELEPRHLIWLLDPDVFAR